MRAARRQMARCVCAPSTIGSLWCIGASTCLEHMQGHQHCTLLLTAMGLIGLFKSQYSSDDLTRSNM